MSKWIKQPKWKGNPAIGFECWMKKFPTPNGRMVPVYVYGCQTKIIYEGMEYVGFRYCVSAGATSDFSYSGGFYPDVVVNPEDAMRRVDRLADTPYRGRGSQLIH